MDHDAVHYPSLRRESNTNESDRKNSDHRWDCPDRGGVVLAAGVEVRAWAPARRHHHSARELPLLLPGGDLAPDQSDPLFDRVFAQVVQEELTPIVKSENAG